MRGFKTDHWIIRLERAIRLLSMIFQMVARLLLALMMFAFCYEAIARYLFNSPTGIVNQLAGYLTAVICFLVIGLATINGEHIVVDVVFNKLRPDLKQGVRRFNEALSLVVVTLFLIAGYAAFSNALNAQVEEYFLNFPVAKATLLVAMVVGFANLWLAQFSVTLKAWIPHSKTMAPPGTEDRIQRRTEAVEEAIETSKVGGL